MWVELKCEDYHLLNPYPEMNKECPISIIIPVYNAASYLPQCLDSIVHQTFRDLQIICIDDGSNDNSLSILHRYAAADKRIEVIEKQNEGVSKARNIGLAHAKGDYVIFVDADDWIDKDTCEIALTSIQKSKADVVLWGYISERNGTQTQKTIFEHECSFSESDVRNQLHRRFVGLIGIELAHPELQDSLAPVWGKLYKRSIIDENGIRFVDLDEIGTCEDGLFNLEVFGFVNKAVYLDKCLYHYRRDNEGSVTSIYRPDLYKKCQRLYERMEKYIVDYGMPDSYMRALQNRRALGVLGITLNIGASEKHFSEKRQELRAILYSAEYKRALSKLDISNMPTQWKFFYGCAKFGNATALLFAESLWVSMMKYS